jgi:Thioesterase-like superfamily
MGEALFSAVDEGRWLPADLSRGPWSADTLHGGPVAALLAREAELLGSRAAAVPMHPARLTVELLRPTPLEPVEVRAEILRPGRKVQLVSAEMRASDGSSLARALLLQIRTEVVEVPALPTASPPPSPDHGAPLNPLPVLHDQPAFHNHGVDHRFVVGQFDAPGPATDWIRLRVPLVSGEEPTPLVRVAAAADFGNGISAAVPFDQMTFINPDLTIYLHRVPVGEWVCLEAATTLTGNGVALSESALYDEKGPIGRSLQSLLLTPR